MLISVVIPLYNKNDTVLRALDSVLNQTDLPDEIIVVNDGSSDGSEEVVKNLNHPLITVIHQKNGGVSSARNKGIEFAKNEWIAFLDADDVWKMEYIKQIKNLAELYPDCNVLATAYKLQDYLGTNKSIILNKIHFSGTKGKLSNYFDVAACSNPPLWSSAVVVKKSAILGIGGFPLNIKSGEDLLTWARLAVENEIAYSLKELSVFIQDSAHTYNDRPNRIPEHEDMVGNELIRLYELNPNIYKIKNYIGFWKKMRASIYLRLGERKNAFKEAISSLYYNPLNKIVYAYIILLILPTGITNKIFKKLAN